LPPELAREVFQAPLGKPLGPVQVGKLHAVYLVQDRRLPDEAAYALVKDQLRRDLLPAAQAEAAEAHLVRIVRERKGRVDEKALAATGDALAASPEQGARVVARAGSVRVKYADVLRALGQGHAGGAPRASPEVKIELARTLLGRALLQEAAWKKLSRDPAVAGARARAERAALAAAVADQVRKGAPHPSSAEVEGRYQARKGEFVTPGGRRCFQLVSPTEEGARKLAARVESGEDFAAVARDSSDKRTAAQGGLIGFVTDGELERVRLAGGEPALAAAVSSLPPAKLSAPIRTQMGFRVIRCEAHVAEKGASLEEVRHRLTMELAAERGAAAVRREAETLRAGARVEVDEAALASLAGPGT
jgi:parvulin-like peptidyl-prolyl isomerase